MEITINTLIILENVSKRMKIILDSISDKICKMIQDEFKFTKPCKLLQLMLNF